jgi:hypothetical protein
MRKLYLLFILITIAPSLFCMEQPSTLIDPPTFVKEIIVSNITYLSHDEVCAWALVSKDYNKIITDTVELRKNHFKYCAINKGMPIIEADITWHKNGSAYTWIKHKKELQPMLNLVYLITREMPCTRSFDYQYDNALYPYVTDDKHRSFFNCTGKAYFHAFSFIYVPNDGSSLNLVEFSLGTKDFTKKSRCLIDLDDYGERINFVALLHFPVLIEAFLQSTDAHEGLTYLHKYYPKIKTDDTAKIYSIKGVTIPDDYALFKKSNGYGSPFTSFDKPATDPVIIRLINAIINKYKTQLHIS